MRHYPHGFTNSPEGKTTEKLQLAGTLLTVAATAGVAPALALGAVAYGAYKLAEHLTKDESDSKK